MDERRETHRIREALPLTLVEWLRTIIAQRLPETGLGVFLICAAATLGVAVSTWVASDPARALGTVSALLPKPYHERLLREAQRKESEGNLEGALRCAGDAESLALAEDDFETALEAVTISINVYTAWNQVNLAADRAEHVLSKIEQAVDVEPSLRARAFLVSSQAQLQASSPKEAKSLLQTADAIAAKLGDPRVHHRLHLTRGLILSREGRIHEAIASLTEALSLAERHLPSRVPRTALSLFHTVMTTEEEGVVGEFMASYESTVLACPERLTRAQYLLSKAEYSAGRGDMKAAFLLLARAADQAAGTQVEVSGAILRARFEIKRENDTLAYSQLDDLLTREDLSLRHKAAVAVARVRLMRTSGRFSYEDLLAGHLEAIELFVSSGQQRRAALHRLELAVLAIDMGRPQEEVHGYLLQAEMPLALSGMDLDRASYALAHGQYLKKFGFPQEALLPMLDSARLFERLGVMDRAALTYCEVVRAAIRGDCPHFARLLVEHSRSLSSASRNRRVRAYVLMASGDVDLYESCWSEAEESYRSAAELLRSHPDTLAYGDAVQKRAHALMMGGDAALAQGIVEELLSESGERLPTPMVEYLKSTYIRDVETLQSTEPQEALMPANEEPRDPAK